jgi:hypothetical protein
MERTAMIGVMDQFTYRLDAEHRPVPCVNDDKWFAWYQDISNRRVGLTRIADGISVSTIFTGLDLIPSDGPPLLFETEVFGGEYGGCRWNFATWDDAKIGHEIIAETLRTIAGGKTDEPTE